ncbi:hypothetical protein PYW08_009195 [Mythimna loreyi]|uniref:Uncharacterized protein n=1 Tax=Mythimna loreyi TaxID=667449 RepID=A0ACC2Q9S3_9NEOP|nr:hypothetical protein PYW08_009195 [Mythimna loreyi]
MDVGKLLKNVHSLNEYISTTQDASEKCKTSRIQLNMSTVLALKKIRSLEIEYFNKCEENGIACLIFERMLCLPPSKTWGVLSKELVNLLQYWLDAVRKHLVRHNLQWWTFLKLLLRFVKEIRQKDISLPNILVEHTAECLLDLATNSRPDAYQRHEILHCFNMYCSESSREIRFALRNKLGQYFTKLSTHMATCGHLPTQYSIMETLLRWLLPRQDRTLRVTSATKWFPAPMYAEKDVDIFLERSWVNFFQDARDFLNAHNQRHDLITSVVCRKLTVGEVVIISGTERQESWLDINQVSGCVSVLLDPRVLENFGSNNHKSFETLVVTKRNTHSVKLSKESLHLVLSIRTVSPPLVLPSCASLGDVSCDVSAAVTTRCDVTRLHDALRTTFEDKYELLLDLDKELELSPLKGAESSNQNKDTDEDPRFSHPVEVKRRKHSGYMVRPRQPLSCMSPSTASTSSLAQLHDKLAALPRYRYDKEPVSVCANPELSIVTELSEADDRQSLNTTLKFKPYGVCYKNQNRLGAESKKSHSDLINLESRKSQSDPESSRKTKWGRRLSPVVNEDTTSCLLVATIGSADDSVINDTVERLSKSKDFNTDNIVDLLVQEALQAKDDRYKSDSGINTGDKKSEDLENSETIDNTPEVDKIKLSKLPKKPKVISSTDDESNTEAVNETPSFVSTRRKNKKEVKDIPKRDTFDEQVVEEFFSQHFTENKVGEIVISPTLAKKINESSSDTSDHFGENFNVNEEDFEEDIAPYDFNEIDVLDCLNSMVDKVCEEFDKCTKYLNKQDEITADPNDSIEDDIPLKDIINKIQDIESKKAESVKKSASKKKIKLKYKIKTPKKNKARAVKRKNKLVLESASKMSTIIEDTGLESVTENIENEAPTESKEPEEKIENANQVSPPIDAGDSKTPLTRRKRKLYSPKDEVLAAESTQAPQEGTVLSEIIPIKKTPKSKATCYKDIEKDRQRIRMPRTRKSKVPEPPSPRTKKMNDMFDKIKDSANSEKIKIAENTYEADVYNFTSDSEDDFKVKKIEISKRNSTTTIASTESTVSKRGRTLKKISYTDNKSSDESNKKTRKVTRKPRTKKKVNVEQVELIDERMRQPKDVFNTSLVVEETKKALVEPDLVLETAPEMEIIEEKCTDNPELKKKAKNIKVEASESKRPKRVLNKAVVEKVINFDDDRTESPLPGLLVEPVSTTKEDITDLSANLVDKFRKIYQEGPENYINESNTTQNLLSDIERINNSPPNIDSTEDLIQIEDLQSKDEVKPNPKERKVEKKKLTSVILEDTKKDKNKPKKKDKDTKKHEDSVEVINVLETTDVKSEKSIATIGITGHGESEEAPPSPKLIVETFEPRNLEVENLTRSMQDYFDKLTKEMNETKNRDENSNTRKNDRKDKSNDSTTSKSPVVSVQRLSYDDISKWLPSRRNSESDQSYVSAKSAVKQTNEDISVEIVASSKIPEQQQDDNDSEASDVNDTIRRSLRLIFKNSQPSKINDSGHMKDDSDSDSDDNKPVVQISKKTKVAPKVVETKKKETISREKSVQKAITKRVSMISPIKLFDELISNADKHSETSLSDDETYMKDIIHTYSKKKAENAAKAKIPQEKNQKKIVEVKRIGRTISSASSHSKISTSTRIEESRRILKRRSEEERGDSKKRKVEVNNNEEVISSGVTVSSVDDWFKRMEPESSRTEVLNATTKHIMQEVLERLDTTLVEINRNTSKKFVNLFIDAQKHLNSLKEKRHGMYKEVASDILSEVLKIMDNKFAGLDKRLQELDDDFMIQLRERSVDLIRDDCKHTRAMVLLLKEDVQAVLDHIDRQAL